VPRPILRRPERGELQEVLRRVISITALAGYYGVSFTTARKWIFERGLEKSLSTEEHMVLLRRLVEEAPKAAKRIRINRELEIRLQDQGDRKLLARAIVDEFSIRYAYKKNGRRRRHTLALEVKMFDPPPVQQVAELMGVTYRRHFRRAKSGTDVPYWETRADGYRAYKILQLVRPYLVGQKATQADVALRGGQLPDRYIDLGKQEYKRNLLASDLQVGE
jgi:hypothetical protein